MGIAEIFKRMRATVAEFARDEDSMPALAIDESGIAYASPNWKPKSLRHRIEIMVTGDPSRVGIVSDAIDVMQKQIFEGTSKPENLELRITGFLDNCIHRSKWNKKPFKAAAQARKWQCEQTQTKFADAFENSCGEFVGDIMIIGHRFDDNVEEALKNAEKLKEQGVRIHCFHTGQNLASAVALEKLARETDGVYLQLEDQSKIGEIMPIMMMYMNNDSALQHLVPTDRDAMKLVELLRPGMPEAISAVKKTG